MGPGSRRAAGAGGWGGGGGLAECPLSPPHPPVTPLVCCPPVGGSVYVGGVRPSAGSLSVRPACVVRASRSAGPRDHCPPPSARGAACGGHGAHGRAAVGGGMVHGLGWPGT